MMRTRVYPNRCWVFKDDQCMWDPIIVKLRIGGWSNGHHFIGSWDLYTHSVLDSHPGMTINIHKPYIPRGPRRCGMTLAHIGTMWIWNLWNHWNHWTHWHYAKRKLRTCPDLSLWCFPRELEMFFDLRWCTSGSKGWECSTIPMWSGQMMKHE